MKCIVYPYSIDFLPVLKYFIESKDDNWNFTKVVIPKSIFLVKDNHIDAGSINKGIKLGVNLTNNFDEALSNCNTVIIADSAFNNNLQEDIIKKIKLSLSSKKDVICCAKLNDEEIGIFNEIAKKNNVNFKYLDTSYSVDKYTTYKDSTYPITTSVMGIGKLLSHNNSTLASIEYFKEYKKNGYDVVIVNTNRNCLILGHEIIPNEFFSDNHSVNDKILILNHFLRTIDQRKSPNLIILQFPDNMMKYSNVTSEDFGIYTYMISQAIAFDYFALVSDIGNYSNTFYKELSTCFKYRFGFEIDEVILENITVTSFDPYDRPNIRTSYVDVNTVDKFISIYDDKDLSLKNLCCESSCKQMAEKSIKTLESYVPIV